MATINLKLPDGTDQKIILTKEVSTVGRDPQNDIVIDDASVSTHHAEIRLVDGVHVLKDLGSTNGLRLNGGRVTEAELNDGDLLRFGGIKGDYVGTRAAAVSAPVEEYNPEPDPAPAASTKTVGAIPIGTEVAGFGGKTQIAKDSKKSALVGLGILAIVACVAAIGMSFVM